MQAFYGGYAFDPNSLVPQTRRRTTFGANGQPTQTEHFIECTGKILGAGQRDIVNKCALLERALAVPFQNFVVKCDDGSMAIDLPSGTALGGVQVVEGPDYPDGDGVEFATQRTFRFLVQATYPASPQAGGSVLVVYEETVTFHGGGPQIVFLEPVNGPPIPQIAKEQRPFYATQTGSAVGLLAYPAPARPLWGQPLETTISRTTPERPGGVLRNFRTTWQYEFGSVTPLNNRGPTII